MTVINTNTASINAQYNLSKVNKEMESAMEALSSGKRINSAGDDAAGIAIASRMESQVRGLNQAMRNAADGQSLIDTAEGAMDEITNMLQRMRELALQSANDTNSSEDRDSLNVEIEALTAEIDRVVSTTAYNGRNILDGSAELNFQIGSEAGQDLQVSISSMGTGSLGSLTGATSSSAVLSNSFQGNAAEVTEVKLAFHGNDTYSFNLNIDDTASTAVQLQISADVRNGSAVDIAGAINSAIVDADLDEYASATVSGNVVTIKHSFGEEISVDTFAANNNGTATYSTINGGTGSDEIVSLGSVAANTSDGFNTVAGAAYVAAADATSGTAATFVEDLSAVDFTTWDASTANLQVDFGDYKVTIATADAATIGDFASAVNSKQDAYTFSAMITDADNDGTLEYSLKAVANTPGVVATGPIISAIQTDGSTNTGEANAAFASPTTLTADVAGVDAADAVEESGGSSLYLDILSADTYTMDLAGASLSFAYDGTAAGRDALAADLEVDLNAVAGNNFSVTHANNRIEILDKDSNALTLANFTSVGNGKIVASTNAAEAGTVGSSEILDDSISAVTAQTVAAGLADATDVDLEFTATDTYSFKISDGNRTAVVDATEVDMTSGAEDLSEMLAAINYGLNRAGMSESIQASLTGTTITLVQNAGREISISDFSADAAGSMLTASGSSDTSGVNKFLDDGNGATADTISQISISTSSSAQDAISIIDQALQDVASERAALGAVSNRLDHTISNLGNVVVNTEASQSRIEDADFAKVTGDLTKAQIMSQAATAMLAQANASKQGVLSLLQG
jgi:flagellin